MVCRANVGGPLAQYGPCKKKIDAIAHFAYATKT